MMYLLLSCNTGGGHNAAARAIAGEASRRGIDCEITNALQFVPKTVETVIEKGHVFAYRKIPKIYGRGYLLQEQHPSTSTYTQFLQYSDALLAYLNAHVTVTGKPYDAVICVHVFPALIMTGVRQKAKSRIPTFFVATDYTCSPSVNLIDVDRWFVPKDLKQEFAQAGVPLRKICETGIPVDASCYHPLSRKEARKKLSLPEQPLMVLLSCGSMGAGHMDVVAGRLLKELPQSTLLAVLTGNNQDLQEKLTRNFDSSRVIAIPFTREVGTWMSASDVLLTKAGGLTSTEAATRGLPTIYMDAVPGLETHNMDYMTRRGLALSAKNSRELVEQTRRLLSDEDARRLMSRRQTGCFSHNSAQELVDEVQKVVEENQFS